MIYYLVAIINCLLKLNPDTICLMRKTLFNFQTKPNQTLLLSYYTVYVGLSFDLRILNVKIEEALGLIYTCIGRLYNADKLCKPIYYFVGNWIISLSFTINLSRLVLYKAILPKQRVSYANMSKQMNFAH